MEQKYNFHVCVLCITYNHIRYIEDALNGFAMQQTTFPYLCAIIDDASTDGEQDCIKGYLDEHCEKDEKTLANFEETNDYQLIFARHKENRNCYFVVFNLKYNHYSLKKNKIAYLKNWLTNTKYIAFCEGDDFWLSTEKLQKQVTILDDHPEIDMCACEAVVIQENRRVGNMAPSVNERIISLEEVISGGGSFFSTNTLLYRKTLLDNYNNSIRRHYPIDYFLQIDGALRGGIYYLAECMAAYRRFTANSWTDKMRKDNKIVFNHERRVLSVLCLFNYETSYKYNATVNNVIDGKIFTLFERGMLGDCFEAQFKKMRFKSKIRLIYTVIKWCLGIKKRN